MAVKARATVTISRIIDILSVTRYYLLQSSTMTAPAKPTTNPPSSWDTVEPSYTSGSTNTLYFVDCTVFTNDTFSYSEVSISSSYEAAKEAYNKAVAAEDRVEKCETSINLTNDAITFLASKEYVDGNFVDNDTYKDDKDETSGAIDGLEGSIADNAKAIGDVDESSKSQISGLNTKLEKYFRFDTNGLTIYSDGNAGNSANALSLVLNNNRISFFSNDREIAWWDGSYLHTGNIEVRVDERAQFGNFAFIPRSDGSLMFLKVSNTEVSS